MKQTLGKKQKLTYLVNKVLCGGAVEPGRRFRNLNRSWLCSRKAYFECLYELKLIVDLMYEGELPHELFNSNNAEFGEYVTGKEVINVESKKQ